MRLLPLALLALVSGCELHGRLLAWSNPVIAPDGARAWAIGCYDMGLCYRVAGKQCPAGYVFLDDRTATESSSDYRAAGGYARGSSRTESVTTLLIRCRTAQ